ncbi:hypothetical protein ACSBR1_022598 [Camellia fascicularis]
MSDLHMYELEDIFWDEFDQTDDHIVPHPGYEHGIEPAFEGNSCKKPRREVIGISSKAADRSTAKYVSRGKGGGFQPLKNARGTMLEKNSWSNTPEGVFPASCDSHSNKEVTSLASDSTRISSHCLKTSNIDTVGTEFCVDDPNTIERCAAVDSNSYRYPLGDICQTDDGLSFLDNDDGWPDIGNFDDVDRMFRSCDSTFGLGSVGNEDEFSWLSSSHTIEESEHVLKSAFKFSCPESSPFKNISEQHEPSKLNNGSSSVNDSNMDCASISYKSSFQASEGGEPDDLGHLTFLNGSDAISEIKDEFAPKEQGVEFNGAVHFNTSTDRSKDENSVMINFHKKQAKHRNQSEGKRKQRSENGGSFHHTGSIQFKDTKFPSRDSSHQAFTSPDMQESSCMSSGLDEISLEASSFRHLQQVMEQLDIRTKLCIRDSLYRLARSAEQRHHYVNLNGGSIDDRDTSGALMAEGTNKCNGFMDMETDTNPIDRSIAHLLFHRPSDPSVIPAHNGSSRNSHTMIHGSITSPPVKAEKLVCQEEAASEADQKVFDH